MSSQAAAFPAAVRRAGDLLARTHAHVAAFRPLYVLSSFIAVQWAAVAVFALTVRHNGWIYYMGGDQLWHSTSAYLLAHGDLGPTLVGSGWATLLVPIMWITGPDLASALPAIVLLCVLVLLPVALLSIYGIAVRLGGRVFGYWAALLWVVAPFITIPFVLRGYHQKYTELTLPQVFGLGAMSDLPSVVALLVGAYLCLRALDEPDWRWGAAAGFAVGYSFVIKPSNAVFVLAPALVFAIYRRTTLGAFAIGLTPPLLLLAFWKYRGYGALPAFAHSQDDGHRVALGITSPFHKYTGDNSWLQLKNNLRQVREDFWSDRLMEFAALAGMVALFIRTRRGGIFVTSWFLVFLLLKGTYFNSRVEDATFWRLLLPAYPAYVLLVAAVPLLLPGVRLRPAHAAAIVSRRIRLATVGIAVAIFFVFPVALVAAATPIHHGNEKALEIAATLVPVSNTLLTSATLEPNGVLLQWRTPSPRSGRVFFRVFRTPSTGGLECTPHGDCGPAPTDTWCRDHTNAPDRCTYSPSAQTIGETRQGAWLDRPAPGHWTYRIGLAANWLDDPSQGDVYVLSPPATIDVPAKH